MRCPECNQDALPTTWRIAEQETNALRRDPAGDVIELSCGHAITRGDDLAGFVLWELELFNSR